MSVGRSVICLGECLPLNKINTNSTIDSKLDYNYWYSTVCSPTFSGLNIDIE